MDVLLADILVIALIVAILALTIAIGAALFGFMSKYDEEVDERAKKLFNGKCPYTGKECNKWTCRSCIVEKRERKWLESEEEE